MPTTEREGAAFINYSQQFNTLNEPVKEFVIWERPFYPAQVEFLSGYPAERICWRKLKIPPEITGKELMKCVSRPAGLYRMDFSMEEIRAG